jgi:hypothetical protein
MKAVARRRDSERRITEEEREGVIGKDDLRE